MGLRCHLCLYRLLIALHSNKPLPNDPSSTGRGALYRLFIYITGAHRCQKPTHQWLQWLPSLSHPLSRPPFFIVSACNLNTNPGAFHFKVITIFFKLFLNESPFCWVKRKWPVIAWRRNDICCTPMVMEFFFKKAKRVRFTVCDVNVKLCVSNSKTTFIY